MATAAPARSPGLTDLAQQQDDVVTRAQLAAFGYSRFIIRNQVRAHRWRLVGRHAVVLHRGPLSQRQRLWVAVLHAGPRAALAGLTAANADGLSGWQRTAVHVVVPKSTGVPTLPGVVVHESRRFTPRDVHPTRTPPRTNLPRSLIDAATWMDSPRLACGLLASAVRQRLVTPAQLREALRAAGPRRHARAALHVLDDIEGGAHALSEIDFVRLCRRGGLPAPRHQQARLDASGRRRYIDADWDLPDGTILGVEVDGALHLLVREWWADQDRQNELTIAGARLLRFPSVIVRLEPDRVVDQLKRALSTFGAMTVT